MAATCSGVASTLIAFSHRDTLRARSAIPATVATYSWRMGASSKAAPACVPRVARRARARAFTVRAARAIASAAGPLSLKYTHTAWRPARSVRTTGWPEGACCAAAACARASASATAAATRLIGYSPRRGIAGTIPCSRFSRSRAAMRTGRRTSWSSGR